MTDAEDEKEADSVLNDADFPTNELAGDEDGTYLIDFCVVFIIAPLCGTVFLFALDGPIPVIALPMYACIAQPIISAKAVAIRPYRRVS